MFTVLTFSKGCSSSYRAIETVQNIGLWSHVTWRERTPRRKFPAEAPPRASSPASLSFLGFNPWGNERVGTVGFGMIRGYSWKKNPRVAHVDGTCPFCLLDDFLGTQFYSPQFAQQQPSFSWCLTATDWRLMSHWGRLTFQQPVLFLTSLRIRWM